DQFDKPRLFAFAVPPDRRHSHGLKAMLTRDEAQKLAQKVLGFSSYPECQVTITASEQAYTRFANNGITTAALGLLQNVTIAVTRDSRTGVYSVDELDDASLRKAVLKAEE